MSRLKDPSSELLLQTVSSQNPEPDPSARSFALFEQAAMLQNELDRIRDQNQKLRRIIFTDPLTGLYNRRALEHALIPRWTDRDCGAVIVLDLDHFKSVNDNHGHKMGDAILESFAGLIRANIRADDRAARYGGEEFVVLVQGAMAREAEAVAARIRAATERYIFPGGIRMTVSAGVAAAGPPAWVKLFEAADAALYEAKRSGRNRIAVSDLGMTRDELSVPANEDRALLEEHARSRPGAARDRAANRPLPKREYWSPAMPGPAPDFVSLKIKH
jgi:diguanylate cyclase (GGDEF)-like protein